MHYNKRKQNSAWDFIRIRSGCRVSGEERAMIIIYTVEAELSQYKQEGSRHL